MEKLIVLGIGNRLMMDDGIGIYVIEELSRLNCTSHISFLVGESDIDYCMDQLRNATFVIIVDAIYSRSEPGSLTVYSIADLHNDQPLDISVHNFHLFQALYQHQKSIKGYLIGIEPYEIKFHIGLSVVLREQWNTIVEDVLQTIETLIENK
ncbi:hydrogenase maturation protease [Sporosarcina sp. UB5]|uniref:hydrogenase maturation protease n=1 Tax=Sporosarcina sp. UB5 TaxID=3047463 RepID=UPI003D794C71